MRFNRACAAMLMLAGVLRPAWTTGAEEAAGRPEPYEREISAFEQADAANPPAPGGILFTGSSSIRLWKLDESFPDLPVLNRGFGGSQIADSVRLMPRTVIPYKPRVIVFYAGDNDIGFGKPPGQVADDFKAFAAKVHEALPGTRLLYISIKPSVLRWALWEKMRAANAMIEEFTKSADWMGYIDITQVMLGGDGRPRAELLLEDGLHLNAEGYKLWTGIVRKALEKTGK